MLTLKETMSPHEYQQLADQGFFTVRRSSTKFWSGTWTDMLIEQFLMRTMKGCGGLTHGRGIEESIQTRWTMSLAAGHQICDQIESYCSVSFETSDQHHGLKDAKILRDNKDCTKMYEWLQEHLPFTQNPHLYSLSTGVVADSRVDCHIAWDKGMKGITRAVDNFNFGNVRFQRKDRVQPLSIMNNGMKIENDVFPTNPITLFQRISVAKSSDDELEQFLSHDLGPYSFSLFDNGLQKGTKSNLYKIFVPVEQKSFHDQVQYVVDGGFLLHKVVWPEQQPFSKICDRYIDYIVTKYGPQTIVVFDSYPEPAQSGTKGSERLKR